MAKRRAVNTGTNGVGGKRRALFQSAFDQIKKAKSDGYHLEVITLCESIIADRLEARVAWVNRNDGTHREFRTLGTLVKLIEQDKSEDDRLVALCAQVGVWAQRRNTALHEMVKLPEDAFETWEHRYDAARNTAADGLALAREVDGLVRKLNQPAPVMTPR